VLVKIMIVVRRRNHRWNLIGKPQINYQLGLR